MMNLKKTLAVVLAFVMVLSMGAISTLAYSDVEAGTITDEAVSILSGLKIIEGFEDGTFRPEETVTRAQMAAIICRTLGYEDQAESSKGFTVFNDVAADHWASGYVNVAQAQGIINGYGDGNFGPEDKVTYEQAVKMIVSALGYDIAAQDKGGYPTGYLAIASAEGITKRANGRVGDAASRGTIAVLVYNSLEVRLMDQYSWSSDGTNTYNKSNANILTHYLDIVKVEGTVTANPITGAAAFGAYVPDEDPFVTIAGEAWVFGNQANYEGYRPYGKEPIASVDALDSTGKFDAERVDVNNLAGKYVIAYIGHDEITDRETVFAIAESKEKNNNLKISANKLVESGHKWYAEAGYAGYKDGGAKRVSLANNVVLYKNFNNLGQGYNTTAAIAAQVPNGGIIEFVSNDGDDEIEYIFVTAYENEAVIEKVEEVNGSYLFEAYNPGANLSKIDPNNENKLFVIYKDGELATAADLAANDTISTVKVAKNFYIYYASSATVTGAVEGYKPEEGIVTISGTDYEVSRQEYYSGGAYQVAKLAGEEGIFFLNVDGQIAYNETAPINGGSYALITAIYKKDAGASTEDFVQAVLADGTVAEYKISDRITVVDADNNTYNAITTKAAFLSEYQPKLTATRQADGSAKLANSYFAQVSDYTAGSNLLVKLAVNSNGVVTKVRLLEGTAQTANGKYDAAALTVGNREFDENAAIFSVKTNTLNAAYALKADETKVGTLADFFADDEIYTLVAFDEDNAVFSAGVGANLAKALAADAPVFVVSGRSNISYNDDDAYVVTGMMDGEEMSITIYNEDGYNGQNPATLQAGDVLAIAEANEEGIVDTFEILNDFNKSGVSAVTSAISTSNVNDEIAQGFGLLASADNKKFAINSAITYDFPVADPMGAPGSTIADWASAYENISYRDANYILVDFSEDFKYPTVTAEGASKALFDYAGYVHYVFVRVVDGKLADVVVYRMAEKSDLVIAADEVAAGDTTVTFTATAGASIALSNLATTSSATLAINGDQIDVTVGALAENDTITVDYTLTKTGYTAVTGSLVIVVGA